ncbi:MAG TPA: hypothetical protein V6D29_10595 [Leptolyngbyaceae cyanobacterium]
MKRLTVLCFLTIGVWIGGQRLGWADEVPSGTLVSQATGATAGSPATQQTLPDAYTQAMLIGYAAEQQGDYQTALINFRRALAERPNDKYARAAIRNMQTYIARQRAEEERLRQIAALQVQLNAAVSQRDWACAAATVDRLAMYFPDTSPEQARLVAYRGELTGFLNDRTNIDQWSTVCPGTV